MLAVGLQACGGEVSGYRATDRHKVAVHVEPIPSFVQLLLGRHMRGQQDALMASLSQQSIASSVLIEISRLSSMEIRRFESKDLGCPPLYAATR